jgi:DNA-binding response OmpR family regulator
MPTGGGTVLVVDDEPSLRLLCRVNLELDGFRVLEAGTVPAARELLNTEHVDLALLDVHVGGQDGRDLLDELRAAEADIRVVMLTGSVDIAGPRLAAADRVVSKPFEPTDLVATVRELLLDTVGSRHRVSRR